MKNGLRLLIAAPPIAAGAYLWLLLRVVLSVPIGVSFLAAAAAIAATAAAAVALTGRKAAATVDPRRGDILVGDQAVRLNPLINVRALRLRFVGAVTLTLFAAWLVIETLGFSTTAQRAISFASAITLTVLALGAYVAYRRRPLDAKQSVVAPSLRLRVVPAQAAAALAAGLGVWQIVATRVFSAEHARWLTFENGFALLALGLGLLVIHESSSERIAHVLEVAGWNAHHERESSLAA
jgi:hypothetical protein